MVALTILLFLLAVYGLANAIAVLKIGRYFLGTEDKRKGPGRLPYFGDLLYCPPCLAFWFGMACSAWFLSPASLVVPVWWKAMLLDGLAACAVAYLLHVLAERLGHGVPGL
jgi:hypothetical protein